MSGLAGKVLSGSAWVFASGVVVRIFSFATQIALGWMLTKQDFGLYGTAVSLAAVFSCFSDSGVGKLLIQKGENFEGLKNPGVVISVFLNLFVSASLLLSGYFYSRHNDNPVLLPLMAVLALSNLLGASLVVCRSGLAKDLRFKALAKIDTVANSISQIFMIPLAFLGAGPFSFVIPSIFNKIYLNYALRKSSGIRISYLNSTFWKNIHWPDVVTLLKGMPWLMISALSIALIQKGDYLVLSAMTTPEMLGVYFFGFQLTVALSSFLTTPLSQIFMPSLAKLNNEPPRQIQAYERSLKAISLVSYPVCFGGVLLAGPAIHFIWNGKWDDAIIVTQLLLLVLPIRFLSPLGRALLEARGKWKTAAFLLMLDGAGTAMSAYWGARQGSLFSIVATIALWRFFVGALQIVVVPLTFNSKANELLRHIFRLNLITFKFLFLSAAALGFSVWISNVDIRQPDFFKHFISAGCFGITYMILAGLILRTEMTDLWRTVLKKKNIAAA